MQYMYGLSEEYLSSALGYTYILLNTSFKLSTLKIHNLDMFDLGGEIYFTSSLIKEKF